MARYGHLLYRVSMLAKQLTRPLLRRRPRAMRPSTVGLDGRDLPHLRAVSARLLDYLVQLCN